MCMSRNEYFKQHYQKNKEKVKARAKAYYNEHKEEIKAKQREYNRKHRELLKQLKGQQ